ncbi:MAG: ribose 5-phosphate isomerase B [Christensenellaceae bacterium]|jgi:ribose 5-phosphate isomerase B|nr:ribose 5-phosphate isomerase B [Christensenellaceae bacterium]
MRIALGCDHGGIDLKDATIRAIVDNSHEYIDYGTYSHESVDYPDYAMKVALAIRNGEADKGILICGTGIGISIAANKFRGIRCAHVVDVFSAQMCVEHNDANIMAMGGRITDSTDAYKLVEKYLQSTFAGGRHAIRVDKIKAIEDKEFNR